MSRRLLVFYADYFVEYFGRIRRLLGPTKNKALALGISLSDFNLLHCSSRTAAGWIWIDQRTSEHNDGEHSAFLYGAAVSCSKNGRPCLQGQRR